MIYGLYLSAAGIMSNAYRQDVLSNNLANAETVGFKRDLAVFGERRTALRESTDPGAQSDPVLEKLGGGILAAPTLVDVHQGDLEHTGNPLDVAVDGDGYFAVVNAAGQKHLTRDGQFMVDRENNLILSTDKAQRVLDRNGNPIRLNTSAPVSIGGDGRIVQNGDTIATLGLFDVPDHSKFGKVGGTLLNFPEGAEIRPATGTIRAESQERSNVDPTTELAQLMDTQRQLEDNANMLRYQDTTLQELVNTVAKIS